MDLNQEEKQLTYENLKNEIKEKGNEVIDVKKLRRYKVYYYMSDDELKKMILKLTYKELREIEIDLKFYSDILPEQYKSLIISLERFQSVKKETINEIVDAFIEGKISAEESIMKIEDYATIIEKLNYLMWKEKNSARYYLLENKLNEIINYIGKEKNPEGKSTDVVYPGVSDTLVEVITILDSVIPQTKDKDIRNRFIDVRNRLIANATGKVDVKNSLIANATGEVDRESSERERL